MSPKKKSTSKPKAKPKAKSTAKSAAKPEALQSQFVPDAVSIRVEKAPDTAHRFTALEWCLNNLWDGADIAAIERFEDDTKRHYGWVMWPRM